MFKIIADRLIWTSLSARVVNPATEFTRATRTRPIGLIYLRNNVVHPVRGRNSYLKNASRVRISFVYVCERGIRCINGIERR